MRKVLLIQIIVIIFNNVLYPSFQIQIDNNASIYNPSDSARINDLLNQAKRLFQENFLTPSIERATEAFQTASSAGDEDSELLALSLLAEIQKTQNKLDEAILFNLQAANILENRKDTISLIHIYSDIAGSYFRLEVYDKAGEYYRKAFDLLSLKYVPERSLFLENMGFSALYDGKPDSAVRCFMKLRNALLDMGKDDTKALYYLIKANNTSGKYLESLKYNYELFERFSKKGDFEKMSSLKNNIAYNFTLLGNYPEAIPAYKEAIEYGIRAGISDQDQGLLMTNTGICLQNTGALRDAVRYLQDGVNKFNEAGDFQEKGRVEDIIAQIYFHEGDLYNAGLYGKQAIESAQQTDNTELLAETCLTYSRILRDGNDPIKALEYYEKYLNLRDSLQLSVKMEEEKRTGLRLQLEKSEKELSLKTKAEQLRKLSLQQLKLQLEKEEREKELLLREAEVERLEKERLRQEIQIARQQSAAEQQEKAKRLLEWENQLKDARLMQDSLKQISQAKEIETLETQKEIARINLERQEATKKLMTWITVLMILVAISILGGLITTRRKNLLLARQKKEIQEQNTDLEQKNDEIRAQRDEIESQRDLLMDQKEEIEHIHSEITKSIEYAKKIQTSTLPELEELNSVAKDSFVFFKPRDIVSGDFYWFASVNGTTVITAADCTGHGVPGAFMSMLGMSLLKEIVLKEYITHPSVILRRLRKEIIAALGQKGIAGEQRDGMDMSLISIDPESHKIEYAGAYNSVYIVRKNSLPVIGLSNVTSLEKGNYVLYNLHADKMPIALFDRMDKFTTHEIQYEEGDQVYLFTDGFADQFGGPKGKKYMYKPFMNLIISNAEFPMQEQYQILAETFDSWKGNLGQVDDICVIGLKL